MSEMSDEEREAFVRQALARGLELSMDGQLVLLRLLDAERAKVARVEALIDSESAAAARSLCRTFGGAPFPVRLSAAEVRSVLADPAGNRTTGAAEAQQTSEGAEKSQELTTTDDR